MKQCCKKCKFCHELKLKERQVKVTEVNEKTTKYEIAKSDGNFEISSVCIAFPVIENDGYKDFALEVDADNDLCEMFTERGI